MREFYLPLEAGLPEIEGSFWDVLYASGSWNSENNCSGAVSHLNRSGNETRWEFGNLANGGNDGLRFQASRSNPIYGRSSTVQPPAIQLIPQIKY